jgi:hypothetical protein
VDSFESCYWQDEVFKWMVAARQELCSLTKTTFFVILPLEQVDNNASLEFKVVENDRVHSFDPHHGRIIQESEFSRFIQESFHTELVSVGTKKAVNRRTSDLFREWARTNVPTEYVRIDIDGMLLAPSRELVAIIEVKRTNISLETWEPCAQDSRDYFIKHQLAKRAGLRFWTLHHLGATAIQDETKVAAFHVTRVDLGASKWIYYGKKTMTARQLLER